VALESVRGAGADHFRCAGAVRHPRAFPDAGTYLGRDRLTQHTRGFLEAAGLSEQAL
jgi:hypothetical protein